MLEVNDRKIKYMIYFIIMVIVNKLPFYFAYVLFLYYHILINSNKFQISFFVALEAKAMNKTIPLKNQIETTWKKQLHNQIWLHKATT